MSNSNESLTLFHARHSNAIIRDGYKLYMTHFRKLVRSYWPLMLAYALIMALFYSVWLNQLPLLVILGSMSAAGGVPAMPQLYSFFLLMAGASLLSVIAVLCLASCGYAALYEHKTTGSISLPGRWYGRFSLPFLWRTLKLMAWCMLITFIICIPEAAIVWASFRYLGHYAGLAFIGLSYVLVLALILPLTFPTTKYMLSKPTHFLPTVTSGYVIGLRHWGSIFIVVLVVVIFTTCLTLITELPADILFIANMNAQLGTLQGDPLNMPHYMHWLNFVVFAVAGFIQACIHLSTLFPLYYLYGSIETREKERNELTKANDEKNTLYRP